MYKLNQNVLFNMCLISFCLFRFTNNNIVKMEYELIIDSICIFSQPSDRSFLSFSIDLETPYTKIIKESGNHFEKPSRKVVGETHFKLNNYPNLTEIRGTKYSDSIQFFTENDKLLTIDDFHYIITENFHTEYRSEIITLAFGAGIDSSTENMSITHLLKKAGLISKLQFSIYRELRQEEGFLLLGGVPPEFIEELKNTSIPIKDDRGYWGVDVNYIFIGNIVENDTNNNTYIKNTQPAHFTMNSRYIEVPGEVYEFILEHYLKEQLQNGQCKMNEYGSKDVMCNCSALSSLKNVSLIINKKEFLLEPDDLFITFDQFCVLSICKNIKSEEFILGIEFIWKYVTIFDFEKQDITFYFQDEFKELDYDKIFGKSSLPVSLGILFGFIAFLFLSWVIYKYLKRRRKNRAYNKALIENSVEDFKLIGQEIK